MKHFKKLNHAFKKTAALAIAIGSLTMTNTSPVLASVKDHYDLPASFSGEKLEAINYMVSLIEHQHLDKKYGEEVIASLLGTLTSKSASYLNHSKTKVDALLINEMRRIARNQGNAHLLKVKTAKETVKTPAAKKTAPAKAAKTSKPASPATKPVTSPKIAKPSKPALQKVVTPARRTKEDLLASIQKQLNEGDFNYLPQDVKDEFINYVLGQSSLVAIEQNLYRSVMEYLTKDDTILLQKLAQVPGLAGSGQMDYYLQQMKSAYSFSNMADVLKEAESKGLYLEYVLAQRETARHIINDYKTAYPKVDDLDYRLALDMVESTWTVEGLNDAITRFYNAAVRQTPAYAVKRNEQVRLINPFNN